MDRTIKFRIWVKSEKKMYDWYDNQQIIKDAIPDDAGDEWTADCELMQFTGLYDKNDKPIYEGDIILQTFPDKSTNNTYVMEWSALAPGDDMDCESHGYHLNTYARSIEVIGNIYETPHLLDD